MREFPIDLQLVKNIWRIVEAINDSNLEEKKNELRRKHDRILTKSVSEWRMLSSAAESQTAQFKQHQIAKIRLEMVLDVMSFVATSCEFYNSIRSIRRLSEAENKIGEDLTSLLQQTQTVISKGSS